MPGFLRQATSAQSRALGPFISDGDFTTPETGLTIANTDIKLVVNGGASANKNSGGGTHRVNGVYGVTFDATDTATVGEMDVSVLVAGALVVFDKFFVVEEVVYDEYYAASAIGYISGAKVDVDTIKTNPVANGGTVTFPSNATLASTTNITAGTITTVTTTTTATNVTTVNGLAANVITAAATATDFGDEIASAIWKDTTAGDFTVAASVGKSVMNGVALGTGLTVARCTLTDTLTTYTGNTVQTGDSFARIGVAGAGLTNIDLPNQTMDITGNITGNLSGSVGSVTGAVGSVTGNVTGTIGGLTAGALKDFFDTDSGTTYAGAVAGSVVKEIADNAGGASLTVQQIVDGVWDEPGAAHVSAGSTGEMINQLDTPINDTIWESATASYVGAGTFGKAVGDSLDAAVSSRMATYTQPAGFLAATFPAGTVANTTNLTAGTITTVSGNVAGSVGSVTGAVGSVTGLTASDVGAIKAKTDNLPEAIKKSTAYTAFPFQMVLSADHVTPGTGLSVSATVSIDGGAFGATANSPTEVSNGLYVLDLAAADTNGTFLVFNFAAATADTTAINVKTTL